MQPDEARRIWPTTFSGSTFLTWFSHPEEEFLLIAYEVWRLLLDHTAIVLNKRGIPENWREAILSPAVTFRSG
jgi:hypothetical protein